MAPAPLERARILEAVDTLRRYNREPFIDDFVREQPAPTIPQKYDKDQICDIIRAILLGEAEERFRKHVVTLPALIAYLDRLQETGRQHVYLFRLSGEQLAVVRDTIEVRQRIGGEDALYEDGILEWEAREGPRLVHVRRDAGTLVLKWVETRHYWVALEEEEVAETRRIQVRDRREERAVSYVVIHLDSGECELRIQGLHSDAQAERAKQLATYRMLIARHLGFEPVGPDVLAPAIRRALLEHEIAIAQLSVILPNGGRFSGRHDQLPPVDIRKLQAGITIAFEWVPPAGGIVRVELDGRSDEIFIRKPLVPGEHRRLLERMRRWRRDAMAVETVYRPEGSGEEPNIDRNIREYVQTHPRVIAEENLRIREQFLDHIREVALAERHEYEREIALVQKDERRASTFFYVAITLALVLFTTGAFLILFYPPMVTIGQISALLSLLSGGATALLRFYMNALKAKRAAIVERQSDSRDTALLIQTAMWQPDPKKRSTDISRVTELLTARIMRTPLPPGGARIPIRGAKRPARKRRAPPEAAPPEP